MRPYLALLVLLAAAVLPGCSGSAQRREIVIGLDQALSRSASRPTILVDVVGLADAERKSWDEMSLSSYWMPESPRRKAVHDRTFAIRFSPEQSQLFVIPIDSDIWSVWRKAGAKWLYVVANLPGGIADQPGADDPRRLAISLTSEEWAPDAPLQIEVRRDAVVFTTPRAQPATGKPMN